MACGVQQIFLETSNKVCYNAETENKWWHIRENARVKRNETDLHRRQPDLRVWCAAVPAVDKAVRTGDAERDICVQRPLVLLMGGANDIFFSGTDTGARANMGAMLNQLLSLGVHTMIGIPTPEGHQIMARRLRAHLKRERQG